MDNSYSKLGVEELIQNQDFVAWVIHQKNNKEWQEFVVANPEFAKTARTAKKIIHLLEDAHDILSVNDVYILWEHIDSYENKCKKQVKFSRLVKSFRYAAVILIAVLLSGLTSLFFIKNDRQYSFSESALRSNSPSSQLILASGERIDLRRDNSVIALKDSSIQINNDSIIRIGITEKEPRKKNEIIVPFGKRLKIVLDDGTKVWLNAGSRFAFPSKFDSKARIVFLEGEAYFEVTHNRQKPFFVNTDRLRVKVLGTRFNLSAYSSDSSIQTILVDGKVAIHRVGTFAFLKKEVLLEPNQKATYNKKEETINVENEPNTSISIDWVSGWFSFSQQNLNDVLRKLERYYNVKFEYDTSLSSNELISGKMDMKESLGDVLSFLADLAKVEFKISGNVIHVKRQINK